MSVYGNIFSSFNESIDLDILIELSKYGITLDNTKELSDDILTEGIVENIKQKFTDLKELRNQWKKVSDKFTKHEWIYRYITEDQEKMIMKYYKMLTDEETTYGEYKKSFFFYL